MGIRATGWALIAGLLAGCATQPVVQGVPRADANSRLAHEQLLQKAHAGRIDVYFLGDSITRRWGATDYPQLLQHWYASFRGWNAADFGWGGDRITNILWRIENGELDGVNPRVIVLMAGTNDVGNQPPADGAEVAAARISAEMRVLLAAVRLRAPKAVVLLMAVLPRNDNMAVMPVIDGINRRIAHFADGRQVRFININPLLADAQGRLREGMMNADQLHPALPTYRIWAEALQPVFTQILGLRKSEDFAPPPTGDPSATR